MMKTAESFSPDFMGGKMGKAAAGKAAAGSPRRGKGSKNLLHTLQVFHPRCSLKEGCPMNQRNWGGLYIYILIQVMSKV